MAPAAKRKRGDQEGAGDGPHREIVELLKAASTPQDAISAAIRMNELINDPDENCKEKIDKFGQSGGFEAAVALMDKFQDNLEFQKECAKGIAVLVYNDKSFAQRAMQATAIPALVRALSHSGVVEVQRNSAWAIRNILAYADEAENAFASEGGLKLLVSAMKEHADDRQLQEHGCFIIWILACDKLFWSHVIEEGCLSVVSIAADRHRFVRSTVEWALKAAEKCVKAFTFMYEASSPST
jgi:hypothetical protein